MQAFDLRTMDDAGREQEACRLRITMLEQRRRSIVQQIGKGLNVQGDLTIARLATMVPEHTQSLLELRKQLKQVVEQVAARNKISGKVAGAVLGPFEHGSSIARRSRRARRTLYEERYSPGFKPHRRTGSRWDNGNPKSKICNLKFEI